MKTYLMPLCAALILLPTVALAAPAQTNEEGARVETQGNMQVLIFDKEDNVDGETFGPGDTRVWSRLTGIHASMISIRTEFISHLAALSDDI